MREHNSTCEICQKSFWASPGYKAKGWGRFCSKTCKGLGQKAQTQVDLPVRQCLNCGTTIRPRIGAVNQGKGKYCSHRCYTDHLPLVAAARVKTRFWRFVDKNGPIHPQLKTRCWEWTGSIVWNGYGHFEVNHSPRLAHRVAYALEHGSIPEGQKVLHKCDNRKCVRPSHLFAGSQAENLEDMRQKSRHMFGERHVHAKLTTEKVQYARARYQNGDVSHQALADELGVSRQTMTNVLARKTWKHVI